jgi:uncharacterized protein with PIN domain
MKFLTDAMLGKLTRILRIFGYDTIYAEEIEQSAPDAHLLEFALENDRIILTKDYPFHKRAGDQSIYLTGKDVYDYLQQLKEERSLNFNFNIKIARCSVCNSTLQPTNKALVKTLVKPETYKYFDNFFQCVKSECKKIYWKGSHIDDILKKLEEKIN